MSKFKYNPKEPNTYTLIVAIGGFVVGNFLIILSTTAIFTRNFFKEISPIMAFLMVLSVFATGYIVRNKMNLRE